MKSYIPSLSEILHHHPLGSQSKALHLIARGVTTVTGSNPGCITSGRDWEAHRAAYNWPSVVRVCLGRPSL